MSSLVTSNIDGLGLRILIVEAHSVSRRMLGQHCIELGFRTSLVRNAREALELCCQISFDLAFIDLSIREIDAYLLARMLREQGGVLVMVAVALKVSTSLRQQCNDAGFQHLLLKPVSVAAIDVVVRRLMASVPVSAKEESRSSRTMILSYAMLLQLAETTELSLSKMRAASFLKRNDLVLQELHAIKGVFAMQNQSEIVAACKCLECAYEHEIPESFYLQINDFQVLIRDNMRVMLASAEAVDQDGAES